MKLESIEMNNKPRQRSILTKIVPMLLVILMKLTTVAAWDVKTDVAIPIWNGLLGIILPLGGIILVAVGMGKASTMEGIPGWTKALLGFITVSICLVLAAAMGSVGSADIGQGFRNFYGNVFGVVNPFD